MCRFVGYFGHNEILLSELIEKPENSLIKQSHAAKEGTHGVNADGFGIAWYNFEVDTNPGIFKSIQPAWNDTNLLHLARKIKSSCFLAHIRASTVGDVNQSNCHPFSYSAYSMVHNGTIKNFDTYKRGLLNELDDQLFLSVKGNTDSESFFFLIMHIMQKLNISLEQAVKKAIQRIVELQRQESSDIFSRLNIVMTNGHEFLATRFVSKDKESLLLNYSVTKTEAKIDSLIVSSESLGDSHSFDWQRLPENHYLYVNKNTMTLKIEPIDLQ